MLVRLGLRACERGDVETVREGSSADIVIVRPARSGFEPLGRHRLARPVAIPLRPLGGVTDLEHLGGELAQLAGNLANGARHDVGDSADVRRSRLHHDLNDVLACLCPAERRHA